MKPIVTPLRPGDRGAEVVNLQDGLRRLLTRQVIDVDSGQREELLQGLAQESQTREYGGATEKVIAIFQEQHQIAPNGMIDKDTAALLNRVLEEIGGFDDGGDGGGGAEVLNALQKQTETLQAINDGTSRLPDIESKMDGLADAGTLQGVKLGTDHLAQIDAHIDHLAEMGTVLPFSARGDAVRVLQAKLAQVGFTLPQNEIDEVILGVGTRDALLQLQEQYNLARTGVFDDATRNALKVAESGVDHPNRIEGRIFLDNGLPADKVALRIINKGFGENVTELGVVQTDAQGFYALPYIANGAIDNLEVHAIKPDEPPIKLLQPKANVGRNEVINLVAPSTLQPLDAEYLRLKNDLTPHVVEMTKLAGAKENAERQDLSVLNRATGWDARVIALAATAERLHVDDEVQIPQEALYGLLRAGLPSDKLLLAQVGEDVAEQALKKVRDADIIGLSDQEIAQVKQQFETFANKVRLAIPAPGSRSTYGQLLEASGLTKEVQDKFAPIFLSHRGDAAQLWENARKAGLDDAQVGKLQLQGKLAFLTGNSEAVTSQLLQEQINDPVQLAEQDFHRTDQWKAKLMALAGNDEQQLAALIPASYGGEKVEDRLNAYAEDMARKVRLSYPTQVIGRLIETDDTFKLPTAHAATVTLLKNAAGHGFRLGETPVAAFVKTHAEVTAGIAGSELQSAQQQLQTLQRVYQITPSNEAMPVLMSLEMTSAYDVMAHSEPAFVELFNAKYLELHNVSPAFSLATKVYRKAKQVSSVTYNLFTIAKQLDSEPPVAGLSAPVEVRESVRNELIKHFPTMESLFGSMDFCECEHCRSVLSPAAYLVDLLQFVDPEPGVWGNFLATWKKMHNDQDYPHKDANGTAMKPYDVLIERRPDLPHIALTCENTNTALPYIDIVNEIMEYYVAHGRLEEKAAHDTGNATTAELLAEPQNVIREAYDKLREARYPLNLPFDLWIETARQFCTSFETPLARLLDVFRPSDDLFAPTKPFDRAAIFMESLGLSPTEVALFTDPDPLLRWHELYGFDTVDQATTEATDATTGQRIDLYSAKALSRRLGVTYKEIVEIVQTGFVNPGLTELALFYKLGVATQDARLYKDHKPFYEQNKDLIGKARNALPSADQQRFDDLSKKAPNTHMTGWEIVNEVAAFEQRLSDLATAFNTPLSDLQTDIQKIPFDIILVLADADAGCNFDLTTLQYADGTKADAIAFLRINLFVRLWRKLGWSIEETDRALITLIPSSAPFDKNPANLAKQPLKTALIYLSHLKALDEKVKVGKQSRLKLLTLWSDIPTGGKNSLYAQLFLTRSVLKTDDVFDHPLGQYLSSAWVTAMAQSRKHRVQLEHVAPVDKIDPAPFAAEPKVELSYDALQEVQYLAFEGVLSDAEKATLNGLAPSPVLSKLLDAVQMKASEFSIIKGHVLALQGALGFTVDEIGRILTDAEKSLHTAEISLSNVSLLHKYGVLAKALKLSVHELIALKRLSGLDPFKPLHPDPLMVLDEDHPFTQTLRFVQVTEEVKESGLKIEDLEYLLRHRFDETGIYRPNAERTLALLKTLSEGIRAIRVEHAVPPDPGALTDETLRQKLGLVLRSEVVDPFLAMMNGTAEFTATRSGVAPNNQLAPQGFTDEPAIRDVRYNATRQEQKLTFKGVLFDDEKAALKARLPKPVPPNPHVPSSILSDLLDDVQEQARSFFQMHLRKQATVQPATGFLDSAAFDLLFAPMPSNLTEAQQQERRRQQRAQLAQAFFPYLQQRLIRQFILQSLTAHTGADPALVESLVVDDRLLKGADSKPLLASFEATGVRGVSAAFFDSVDLSGTPQAVTSIVRSADMALKDTEDAAGNPLNPANSAEFEGYLEIATPGAYRFYIELDTQDAEAELRFEHLPDPVFLKDAAGAGNTTLGDQPNEFLELKLGVLYRFNLKLQKLNGGGARLLVQGETLPKDGISQLTLYPLRAMAGAESAILLLSKVLQLVQSLGLSEREIRYVLSHAPNFGGVNLSQLPTQPMGDTLAENVAATERFARFLRLTAYARLKRALAASTDDLIDIFEANELGDADTLDKKVYPLIAKLTRRNEATIKTTANALATAPHGLAFKSEEPLWQLWETLQVVERFGVPVASLLEWTRIVSMAATPQQRFTIARDLKEAIKARFDPETWQRVAQSIFDTLRQRQRDALVSHVMHQHGFDRMEQLYEYFLMDPGMEPVVQTSRIRLAISSLQLFIQRCLLNLELKVHPSTINAKHWEWMKRYRVWEANRKIFLFPQNWLEPEFRDDKTHLFAELEGALLQGDVSSDLAEDAFLNYLKKLDELARLDMVAMHIEDNPDPARRTLHVFGRTYSQPHKYFYRRYAHQMWTPWEPVSAEIEGNHLAPVVWRDRLYLFWVTFMEKAAQNNGAVIIDPSKPIPIPAVQKELEVQLHWSTYLEGNWSTRESGGVSNLLKGSIDDAFNPTSMFIHVTKEPYENGEERGVYIHLSDPIDQAFYLAGRNSTPEKDHYSSAPANPYSSANDPRANRYAGSGDLKVSFQARITTEPGKTSPKANPSILQGGDSYIVLPCDNNLTALGGSEEAFQGAANPEAVKAAIESGLGEIASLTKPMFYQDNRHTLFVEPEVTERTIEEWQEWVTRTPQPESDWRNPHWWEKVVVIPEIPRKRPFPELKDPRLGFEIDQGSLINPRPDRDWLMNPATVLTFDDALIGPTGQPGLHILAGQVAEVIAIVDRSVNVNPGSALAAGSVVVRADEPTFKQSGLIQATGGINVVGNAGFTSALEKNFNELNRKAFGAEMRGAGRNGR